MIVHKRKLLNLPVLVALSFSQGILGSEGLAERDNGNGTVTLTKTEQVFQDSKRSSQETVTGSTIEEERLKREAAEQQKTREFLGIGPDYKPSLWDIPYFFVKSLFQPFIEDAPKVLDALRTQEKIIEQDGIGTYVSDLASGVVQSTIENPRKAAEVVLGTTALVGAATLGYCDLGDSAQAVLSMTATASVLKTSLPIVDLGVALTPVVTKAIKDEKRKAEEEGISRYVFNTGRTVFKVATEFVQTEAFWTAVKVGIYGGVAYYVLSSIPMVGAQYTPVFGTEYQINQNPPYNNPRTTSFCFSNGACATGWVNSGGNMVARIHFPNNGTFVTSEFAVSTTTPTVSSTQLIPCVGGFSNNNWFMSWLETSSILRYRIMNPTGGFVISPTQVNSAGETFVQVPSCVGLGSRGFIGWANNSAGMAERLYTTFSSDGTSVSGPTILDPSTAASFASPGVTGLGDGNAWVLGGTSSLQATEISPTGSLIGSPTPVTINPALAIIDPTGLVGGSGKDALLLGTSGGTDLKGISIQNGVPSSTQFTVHTGTAQIKNPTAAGLIDGNALVAFEYYDASLTSYVNATLISPSGSLLSTEFTVPTSVVGGIGNPSAARLPGGGSLLTMGDSIVNIKAHQITFTSPPTTTSSPSSTTGPTSTSGSPTTTGVPTTSGSPTTSSGPTTTGTPTPTSNTSAPTSAASSLAPSFANALFAGVALFFSFWGS